MKRVFARLIAGLLLTVAGLCPAQNARETLSLDHGWLFHLGDIPFPVIQGHGNSYNNAKAGKAWGAAAPDYDDTKWRELNLPHDWVVEGPFDPKENLSQGYRPRGIAWYRRHFKLPGEDRGRHIELTFDGVATHCTVWVNGILAHRNWCGYTSFSIDLTPFARFGDAVNTIAVRVDANAMEGWWYEGGGIYRHTWLVKRDPVHIATDGVYANPVCDETGKWRLPVEVIVNSAGQKTVPVEVETTLLDPAGKVVTAATTRTQAAPFVDTVAKLSLTVDRPQLWSVEQPVLYSVRTIMKQGGIPGDSVTTHCGFRTLRFDAKQGFFLNGQPVKLKGVCNHQDHAGVGVAVPDALWEFRLRKLKEMGVNAYRCSHNPPSKEFLDLCDRMGMLVMDENRNFNPTPEYMRQLEWLVRRDRNHPSVILWSVFNEEPMQGSEQGYEMVRRMSAAVKRLDATRPVTAAMNGGQFTPLNVADAVDVVGFNYSTDGYDRYHAAHPDRPMTSSEDTSAFMTRGEYVTDKKNNVIASYDDERAPWGATHRSAWKKIATRPFLAGGFVWTGFDYRGEPTPHSWPSVGSFFGCLDLCGFPKVAFYMHQAHWIEDKPVLQLIPHWNWPGRESQPVRVMAIANCDTVALSLNGQSLGEKPVDTFDFVEWQVPYAPGRLEAIGLKGGKQVSRCVVETTGEPVALQVVPDRPSLAGDGWDAQPVTIQAVDAQGRVVPTAKLMAEFELRGAGEIIGVGNGDPNCHEPEKYLESAIAPVSLDDGWKWTTVQDFAADRMAEVQADFDDSKWQSCGIAPERGVLPTGKHGVFRRQIVLTTDDLDSSRIMLSIGTVDDRGLLYVNGRKLGAAATWATPLVADIKRALHEGTNVIAVSVFNETHDGGLGKGASLSFAGKRQAVGWKRSLFNGLAQVIVQTKSGGEGQLVLRAKAAGLKSGEAAIDIKVAPAPPMVGAALQAMVLHSWRMSPVSATRPDPNAELSDNDQNSWTTVEAGRLQGFSAGSFGIYRIRFEPATVIQTSGGKITFPGITGRAEVWLDGQLAGTKDSFDAGQMTVELPPGKSSRLLSVLIEAKPGQKAGFSKLPLVEE